MVRYLKIKAAAEEENVPSAPSLVENSSGSPANLFLDIPASSDQKTLKTKSHSRIRFYQENQEALLPPASTDPQAEDLKKKVQELQSKLSDYEEFIRKKETAQKLAAQLNQEHAKQIPEKKISVRINRVKGSVRRLKFPSLKKFFLLRNLIVIARAGTVVMFLTYILLLLIQLFSLRI